MCCNPIPNSVTMCKGCKNKLTLRANTTTKVSTMDTEHVKQLVKLVLEQVDNLDLEYDNDSIDEAATKVANTLQMQVQASMSTTREWSANLVTRVNQSDTVTLIPLGTL